jgi:hypothetical protein
MWLDTVGMAYLKLVCKAIFPPAKCLFQSKPSLSPIARLFPTAPKNPVNIILSHYSVFGKACPNFNFFLILADRLDTAEQNAAGLFGSRSLRVLLALRPLSPYPYVGLLMQTHDLPTSRLISRLPDSSPDCPTSLPSSRSLFI